MVASYGPTGGVFFAGDHSRQSNRKRGPGSPDDVGSCEGFSDACITKQSTRFRQACEKRQGTKSQAGRGSVSALRSKELRRASVSLREVGTTDTMDFEG